MPYMHLSLIYNDRKNVSNSMSGPPLSLIYNDRKKVSNSMSGPPLFSILIQNQRGIYCKWQILAPSPKAQSVVRLPLDYHFPLT